LDRRLPEGNAAATSQQLSFYHLLVWEGLGVKSEEVRLYYLRHGVEQVSQRDTGRSARDGRVGGCDGCRDPSEKTVGAV